MVLVPDMILPAALMVTALLVTLFVWSRQRRARLEQTLDQNARLTNRVFVRSNKPTARRLSQ